MRYLITESKLNNAIESFIRKSFPEVVSVTFGKSNIMLGSDENNRIIERTLIKIILDPNGVLNGNTEESFKSVDRRRAREIRDMVDSFFSLDISKYGSDWDINVYLIKAEPF